MVDFKRLHNVYSNDEINFIDNILSYLIEQGFFLTLINGEKAPITLKKTEKNNNRINTNLLGNLSISAHDVVVAYLNRERLFSIVFEHNETFLTRSKENVIFSKYDNTANASDVIDNVIIHNKNYIDVIFSAARHASINYEVRPKISEIIFDKKINNELISCNENSACVIRISKMIKEHIDSKNKEYDNIDKSILNKAFNYISSNGYSFLILENDFMKSINTEDDLANTNSDCYAVVRSNGGVVGFIKSFIDKENSVDTNKIKLKILNNIWNCNLNTDFFLKFDETNCKKIVKDSNYIDEQDKMIKKYGYIQMLSTSLTRSIMQFTLEFIYNNENSIFGYKKNNNIYSREEQRLDDLYKKVGGVDFDNFWFYLDALITEVIIVRKTFSYSEMCNFIDRGDFDINTKNKEAKYFFKFFDKYDLSENEFNDILKLYRKMASYIIRNKMYRSIEISSSFSQLGEILNSDTSFLESIIEKNENN